MSASRTTITFDDSQGDETLDVVLRSAALLMGSRRVPIPVAGLRLGAGAEVVAAPSGKPGRSRATVEPTPSGHVVIASEATDSVYCNGERLLAGERRPLARGDTLSIDGVAVHYLPAGQDSHRLNKVTPVDAGRIRTSGRPYTLGRAKENDLVLDHPTVQREHAVVATVNGEPVLHTSGAVRVNGAPAQRRQVLRSGDQLAIGPFRIAFDGEELFDRDSKTGLPIVGTHLNVTIDGHTILESTDVQLRPSQLVAVIGPSGAGKSTLLKVLAGVTRPTGGQVLAGGEAVTERLTDIGYVPQSDIVHGLLTAREALDFAARLRLPSDTSDSEREARVDQVLGDLGLANRADVRVGALSGGQRKRVAVGVELLHRPGAMFLDEPTTGLDPWLERKTMEVFRSLARNGQTVMVVTHATASLATCDRVIVMAEGGVVAFDGSPTELLDSFEIESFDEVYSRITPERRPSPGASPVLPPLPALRRSREQRLVEPMGYQVTVLARRYLTLILRDRHHLRSALLQGPALAFLTALLFKSDVFTRAGGDHQPTAGKAAQLLFLMVTVAVWLGAISAAREIVKERSVTSRELAIGVSPVAYVCSKLVVLAGLVSVQAVSFGMLVVLLRPLHDPSGAGLQIVFLLCISSWLGILIGLVVSAFSRSEDQATGLIPLVLIPQLLLGGALVTLNEMSGAMSALADLAPARWAFAAAGTVMDMNERIAEDAKFSTVSTYGDHFFSLPIMSFVLIALAFAAGLSALVIRRVDVLRNGGADDGAS